MLRRTLTEGQTPREIAAPFQNKPRSLENGCNIVDSDDVLADVNKNSGGNGYVFPALESDEALLFDTYCGPTPESNWVIPGKLLVGAYPASQSDDETFDLITSILKYGVSKFVCLQEEYREYGVTEAMWRSGNALRPYFEDVKNIVTEKRQYEELNDFSIVDIEKLSFIHFPIRDCGITDDSRVLELAKTLVQALKDGEIIYLHCWGGHGRTGTVVCIMLHLIYGLDATRSMARCQSVHDLRRWPVAVGSPQTQTQRDQVTRVINKLINTPLALRRHSSEPNKSTPMDITPMQHSPRPIPQHEKQNNTISTPNRGGTNDSQNVPQASTPNPLLSSDLPASPNAVITPVSIHDNDANDNTTRIRSVSGAMDICSLDDSLLNSSCGEEYADCVQNQAELLALNNGNLNLTFAHEADSNNIVGNSGIDIDEDTLDDDDDDGNEVRNVEIVNSIVKPPNTEKPSFNRLRKG